MNTVTDTREINTSTFEVECGRCFADAKWKITDGVTGGVDYACTVHGTEWYPHLFPESDTTPIEEIIASAVSPIGIVQETPLPGYPLMGHRQGLRMNDMVTLASAFSILDMEGGTARHGYDFKRFRAW